MCSVNDKTHKMTKITFCRFLRYYARLLDYYARMLSPFNIINRFQFPRAYKYGHPTLYSYLRYRYFQKIP